MICLPKGVKDAFRAAVKEGKINPEDLSLMNPDERHAMFERLVGPESASTVNALFESKLLLKNQEQGFITAIKKVLADQPTLQKDLVNQVQKIDHILNPAEEKAFLKDLAAKKLGTDVTFDEAKQISELSNAADQARKSIDPSSPIRSNSRMKAGKADIDLSNFINDLKVGNKSAAENVKATLGKFKTKPLKATSELVSDLAGVAKGSKASGDLSALLGTGFKTLFTNPKEWAINANATIGDFARQLGKSRSDNAILNTIKADIHSRPNFLNGIYEKMKLAVGTTEEAFPTHVIEKIPILGNIYKASEVAYTGFLYRMRADIADKLLLTAEQNGVDTLSEVEQKSIGNLVNSLTGRGNLGRFEKYGDVVNNVFFSPRRLVSNLEFLTGHNLQEGVTPFVRKQARQNIVKVIGSIAGILALAETVKPGSVELDPRSADFGKIRIGDTRFDVSNGMGSILTLAARLASSSSKSSTTGKVTELNARDKKGRPVFGAQSRLDVLGNFFGNKLSPIASVTKDLINQETFEGDKPTFTGEVGNLLTPLTAQNTYELLHNPKSADNLALILAGTVSDASGIATNTYSSKKKKSQ